MGLFRVDEQPLGVTEGEADAPRSDPEVVLVRGIHQAALSRVEFHGLALWAGDLGFDALQVSPVVYRSSIVPTNAQPQPTVPPIDGTSDHRISAVHPQSGARSQGVPRWQGVGVDEWRPRPRGCLALLRRATAGGHHRYQLRRRVRWQEADSATRLTAQPNRSAPIAGDAGSVDGHVLDAGENPNESFCVIQHGVIDRTIKLTR